MLRSVYLHGDLGEKYGKSFKFDVNYIGESLRALEANFPGFRKDIIRDQEYIVWVGEPKEGQALDNESVFMKFNKGDFHICPALSGAKSTFGAIASTVIGVVLMVASIWVPPAGVAGIKFLSAGLVFNVGLAVAATGIMGMITPTPQNVDYTGREDADERPGFLFDGPVNTVEQGGALPIIYGRMMVGSTLISTALDVEDV